MKKILLSTAMIMATVTAAEARDYPNVDTTRMTRSNLVTEPDGFKALRGNVSANRARLNDTVGLGVDQQPSQITASQLQRALLNDQVTAQSLEGLTDFIFDVAKATDYNATLSEGMRINEYTIMFGQFFGIDRFSWEDSFEAMVGRDTILSPRTFASALANWHSFQLSDGIWWTKPLNVNAALHSAAATSF